jgi:hypothetical protein
MRRCDSSFVIRGLAVFRSFPVQMRAPVPLAFDDSLLFGRQMG